MPRQPKLTYVAVYEPDMERMVKALRVVLAYQPEPKQEAATLDHTGTDGGGELVALQKRGPR